MARVKTLKDIGRFAIESFEDGKEKLVMDIHKHLMNTTPVRTGTLKSNWRMTPGSLVNRTFIPNTGETRTPKPIKNAITDYVRNWKKFVIYNNTPYVNIVNDGINGNEHNQNFIQKAIALALAEN